MRTKLDQRMLRKKHIEVIILPSPSDEAVQRELRRMKFKRSSCARHMTCSGGLCSCATRKQKRKIKATV